MRRWTGRVAVTLAGVLLASGVALPPSAAADGHTAVVTGSANGWWSWDAADGDAITVTRSGAAVVVGSPGGPLKVTPPTGQALAPGEYAADETATATVAGLDVGGGCLTAATLTVHAIERAPDGAVTSLSLSYDARSCYDWYGHVYGDVRFHAARDWWGVRTPRDTTSFGTTGWDMPVTRTIPIARTGTLPVTLGAASFPAGSPFSVADNRCDDAPLAADATCEVDVVFTPPRTTSGYHDRLTVVANSGTGSVSAVVAATVNAPPPTPKDPSAVAGVDGIGVTWPEFGYNEVRTAFAGYRLYRDGDPTPVATTQPWARTFTDPAAPGETRTYRVTAYSAYGESAPSGEASATVPTTAPSPPGTVNGLAFRGPTFDWAGPATAYEWPRPGGAFFSTAEGIVGIRPVSGSAWVPGPLRADVSFGIGGIGGCGGVADLTVHEAHVHADGRLVVLALAGDVPCGGEGKTGHIDVRYAATTPVVLADATPDRVERRWVTPETTSPPATVTVTNKGTTPLVLGAAAVSAPEWSIADDACSGRTVAAGAACTLGVRFSPAAVGHSDAVLTIPDNTAAGQRAVALYGLGGGAPSVPTEVAAVGLAHRVTLTWSLPKHADPAVEHYRVQRSTSATTGWQTIGSASGQASVLRYADTKRTPGVRVYYRVAAVNHRGSSPYSAPVSAVPSSREIFYTADDDGSGTYRLESRALPSGPPSAAVALDKAFQGGTQEDPAPSPDGTKLLYTREVPEGGRLHLFQTYLHGTMEEGLAEDGAAPMTYRDPAWAPDSNRYAFACKPVAQEAYDVCVAGESTARKVVATGARKPAWLPNGNELLVVSGAGIDVVAADGSYRKTIPGTANARSVAVSPDGLRIAWVRFEGTDVEPGTGETPRYSLRVSSLDAGPGKALVDTGFTNDPAWAPDGGRIYYTHTERTPEGALGNRDIFSVAYTGGTPAQVTDTPAVDEDNVAVHHPGVAKPVRYPGRQLVDFTGDGYAEIAVFRPGTGTWLIRGVKRVQFGRLGDVPVAADYTGDRKADIAVFRPSTATWYVTGRTPVRYGKPGDIPVPADYDGDGRADIAVYRPSNGTWYVRNLWVKTFGRATDVPVPADYTGDRKADIAVYRPAAGDWLRPGRSTVELPGDPIPGDYAGIGRAQIATYHPTGAFLHEALGQYDSMASVKPTANEVAVHGNVTSQRGIEPGVFNPTLGLWRLAGRANVVYGTTGDIPV